MKETFSHMLQFLDTVKVIKNCENASSETSNIYEEAQLTKKNFILLLLSKMDKEDWIKNFYGDVIHNVSVLPNLSGKAVYLCGDLASINDIKMPLDQAKKVSIVRERSTNYETAEWPLVGLGQVPMDIHGVGVFYRRFFDTKIDYFNQINSEHEFQSLTESNKPGRAHRTGIYLTKVESKESDLQFHLLRCSTNFTGPTGNFRETDTHIVDALNQEANHIFENQAPLNHVLAQIYWNNPADGDKKQTKAKIKAHADKTKDMPGNGIMAFCTFYHELEKLRQGLKDDQFDYGYKKGSGMTKLVFRLKKVVAERPGCKLKPHFEIKLYPDSVFFMPLSTNRFYTHEISPAHLDAAQLPTRMGYVVRCSNTLAVHKEGATYFKTNAGLVSMEPPTSKGFSELRSMYARENSTDDYIDYAGKFLFSMNKGDYIAPIYEHSHEFRQYEISFDSNPYEQLRNSIQWEQVTKGRQGTVLVKSDSMRGIPIVRTTTKYEVPAQKFQPVHFQLAEKIERVSSVPFAFNNALIENYTNAYFKMGFHSDQALDLREGSHIAIFSCYKNPHVTPLRKLIVESKEPGDNLAKPFQIELKHNSVIVFSLDTNYRFKHKIVLDVGRQPPENEWLGVTFRTSKTFVKIQGEKAYFEDGSLLTMADESQRRKFFKLRGRENREIQFEYPSLSYTISKSDMLAPI